MFRYVYVSRLQYKDIFTTVQRALVVLLINPPVYSDGPVDVCEGEETPQQKAEARQKVWSATGGACRAGGRCAGTLTHPFFYFVALCTIFL